MENDSSWSLDALRDVLLENINERKRERRHRTIFRLIRFSILLLVIYLIFFSASKSANIVTDASKNFKHIAKIKIEGVISDNSYYGNAENINKALEKAFTAHNTVGVLLDLNSPGGSAVQSNIVFEKIMHLRKKYPEKPVYAVVSDLCASGCYYIASASDKIYADPVSIVGSIGVIYSGFGFVDTISKLGMERRVLTAGEHKDIMDPFKPESSFDKSLMQNMLNNVHKKFIESVKLGRGQRLKLDQDNDLFSGKFWLAEDGLKIGLIDELGHTEDAISALKVKKVVDYTVEPDLFRRLSKKFSADTLLDAYSAGSKPQLLRALY